MPDLVRATPLASQLVIVLVQTSHPANIGSVARAMKTMGVRRLHLVAPLDFPSVRAQWLAAGAEDVLTNAQVFTTLPEAIATAQLVIGTSARQRQLSWPHLSVTNTAQMILAHLLGITATDPLSSSYDQDVAPQLVDNAIPLGLQAATGCEVALVFGRESSGLTNDELRLCHLHTSIDGDEAYSVLNLAQAVQIYCYELRKQWLTLSAAAPATRAQAHLPYSLLPWDEPLASHAAVDHCITHLEASLQQIGFLKPHNHAKIWPRLVRLLQRQRLDGKETALIEGLAAYLERIVYDNT